MDRSAARDPDALYNRSDPKCPGWYQYLLTQLNARFADLPHNNVVFLTFNYDRSLEQFLFNAFLYGHKATPETAAEAVQQLPIIHLHGQLGATDWQAKAGTASRQYSPGLSADAVQIAAKGITLVSEASPDADPFARARVYIEEAEQVVFLAFAYNASSMDRLGVRDRKGKLTIGTCLGLGATDRSRVIQLGVTLKDLDSLAMLRNHVIFAL